MDSDDIHYDLTTDFGDLTEGDVYRRAFRYSIMLFLYFALAWVFGLLAATPIFLLIYMLVGGVRPLLALSIEIVAGVGFFLVFDTILNLPWPQPMWDGSAWLRDNVGSIRVWLQS